MDLNAAQRLLMLLEASGRPFQRMSHPRVDSSAKAAEVRGTPLHIGGKSLVMKGDGVFGLFVLPGTRRTHGTLIRRELGLSRLRFATPQELAELTGLEPGCVPPFGHPVFDLPLYVDQATADNAEIAFSLADHEQSVRMRTADYLEVARPLRIFSFSRD